MDNIKMRVSLFRLSKTLLPPGVLKTLSSQIIDHSNFAAQRDLALDDEAENKPCRHQLRNLINGLWIKWRPQHEDHALFVVREDERGSAFEGDTLISLSNETVRDTSSGQCLIDVVACAPLMFRKRLADEQGWCVLTHG